LEDRLGLKRSAEPRLHQAAAALATVDWSTLKDEAERLSKITDGDWFKRGKVLVEARDVTPMDIIIEFVRFILIKVSLYDWVLVRAWPTPIMESLWKCAILNTPFYRMLCEKVNDGYYMYRSADAIDLLYPTLSERGREDQRQFRVRRVMMEYCSLFGAIPLECTATIHVLIWGPDVGSIDVEIVVSDTVAVLKQLIQKQTGWTPELAVFRTVLEDTNTLSHYGIGHRDPIFVVPPYELGRGDTSS